MYDTKPLGHVDLHYYQTLEIAMQYNTCEVKHCGSQHALILSLTQKSKCVCVAKNGLSGGGKEESSVEFKQLVCYLL